MRSGFKGRPEGMAGKWATANVANLSRMDATDQSQRAEACMGGGKRITARLNCPSMLRPIAVTYAQHSSQAAERPQQRRQTCPGDPI